MKYNLEKYNLEKCNLERIKDFINAYFDYTTTISITESEWLSKFEWLEDWHKGENDFVMRKLYHNEALKDLLFDLIFNQDNIKKQFEIDLDNYETDSEEYSYIKNFYNMWKDLFCFEIDELEV